MIMKKVLRSIGAVALTALFVLATAPGALGAPQDAAELRFTVLHTNDEHSALLPHSPAVDHHPERRDPTVGGFARLATVIQGIRETKVAEGEPVLVLNAGDFLGGSAFGWLAPQGHAPELALLQAMGYDAVVIGNHEYDYGPDVLARYLRAAGYPDAHEHTLVLATNTEPPEDHPLAAEELLRQTALLQLDNGLTVGLLGLIGEDAVSVSYDTGAIRFPDPHQAAREAVASLNAQGADVIVAITHSGVDEDVALARAVPGIHVIVGGHSHTALYEPLREGDTLIVQAYALGQYLGRMELSYNPTTGRVRTRNEERDLPYLIPIDDRITPHPEIEALVGTYTDLLNAYIADLTGGVYDDIMAPVARSAFVLPDRPPLRETPMGNFITDAMRLVTEEITGERVHVAVQANGNIRGSLIPGTTAHARGLVSFYDIAEIVGLGYGADGHAGYPIVAAYLTGDELFRLLYVAAAMERMMGNTYFLQFSGLRYTYRPAGMSVRSGELFLGEGVQPAEGDEGFVALRRGDRTVYRVVTDALIYSFLPLAGELMPHLALTPRNADGEPVPPERMHELFVRHEDGREVKVWETVIRYAASLPRGADDLPEIPAYYAETSGRINPQ